MSGLTIPPLDELILNGTLNKLAKVFNCSAHGGSAEEKMHLIRKTNAGDITYPYLFLSVNGVGRIAGRYNSALINRYGVTSFASNTDTQFRVRLLPARFNCNVEFITNTFYGPKGVLEFSKRWLFAGKNGHLKFNVKYGSMLTLPLHMVLDEDVNIPDLSNKSESAPEYRLSLNLIVEGFVGENELSPVGTVKEIHMDTSEPIHKGSLWAFGENQ